MSVELLSSPFDSFLRRMRMKMATMSEIIPTAPTETPTPTPALAPLDKSPVDAAAGDVVDGETLPVPCEDVLRVLPVG